MMKKLFGTLAVALALSGCAHNGYYNGGWNPHYNRNHTNISDGQVVALVGAIGVLALIDNAGRQREHQRELLNAKPAIVQINGVWHKEEYKVYKPCPVDGKRQCTLLTRTPLN
jgi:hypothetical protein